MVMIHFVLLFLSSSLFLAAEIRVQAEADQGDHFENLPVPVTIIVTHPPESAIDEASFMLGTDQIQVEKVKDVGDTGGKGDILTIYHYDLPNKPKGLHVLPSISVKIGKGRYKSVASTFEVKAMGGAVPPVQSQASSSASSSVSPSTSSSEGVFLRLENIVQGQKALFVGQTITLGYRYLFNGNIETTDEVVPLFEPKGFVKLGDKIVAHKDTADTSVLEVTQRLQAETPGVYQVGPSSIEGYVYTEDSLGRRTYSKNKLKSSTPVVTLTVKPVPAENKPLSFSGAIGKYTFKVSLQSPSKVTVGDEMSLLVEIGGSGDLEAVRLPDFCCQPGMSGLFKLSDLPPVGKIEGRTKRFIVSLRPLTPDIKEIPRLEFSFFDPEKQKFETVQSSPIPISVSDLKIQEEEPPVQEKGKVDKPENWGQALLPPIEVGRIYPLDAADLQNTWFGSWWMLMLPVLGAFLLIYQHNLKRFLAKRPPQASIPASEASFALAWQEAPHSSSFYAKLYQAFFERLQERHDIGPEVRSIDKLPNEGAAGDVKVLLLAIEETRYSREKEGEEEKLLEQARRLFTELEVKA